MTIMVAILIVAEAIESLLSLHNQGTDWDLPFSHKDHPAKNQATLF